jgi:hypothetical protein
MMDKIQTLRRTLYTVYKTPQNYTKTLHHNIVECVQIGIRELNVSVRIERDCETLWKKLLPDSEWWIGGALSKISVNVSDFLAHDSLHYDF